MPYYKENLLSAWPSHLVFEVGAPPPKIDPSILANMTRTEMGFFAKNPRTKRRNQAESRRQSDRVTESLTAPKFLSEQSRTVHSYTSDTESRTTETMESLTDLHLEDVTRKEVPSMYGNVEIKYSKFGVDDFDFAYVLDFESSGGFALTALKVLQPDYLFWFRDAYRQLLCQLPFAALPIHPSHQEHSPTAHCLSMLVRVLSPVRIRFSDRHVGEGSWTQLSSLELSENIQRAFKCGLTQSSRRVCTEHRPHEHGPEPQSISAGQNI